MNAYNIYISKGMDESNTVLRAENINDARRKLIRKYLQKRIDEGYRAGERAIFVHVMTRASSIGMLTVNPWTNRPVWAYKDSKGNHMERDVAIESGALIGKARRMP